MVDRRDEHLASTFERLAAELRAGDATVYGYTVHTAGCTFVTMFATSGCRIHSYWYSRQYQHSPTDREHGEIAFSAGRLDFEIKRS
jgi:hypothetical protein